MSEMTEFVKFGTNWTFWYLKSWISDTKCPIVTKGEKREKPALLEELVDNCDISVCCGHSWFPNETELLLWRILEQMKVYSNRNVINDKTKWNDTVKLKSWISLEQIEIEGWGFLHSISYASGHILRWFTMVFAVFDISPVLQLVRIKNRRFTLKQTHNTLKILPNQCHL